jgi:tRNA (guanine37-N1)-methyltransferase
MVLTVNVTLADAEQVKRFLFEKELFLEGYRYEKDGDTIYFPVKEKFDSDLPVTFVEKELEAQAKKEDLKSRLQEVLSDEELEKLKRSMDQVGSIAIIEVDDELVEKESMIAETILSQHKQLTTVLKKVGGHEGELRLQKFTCLAGVDTRETIVVENGVRLKIDVEGVYYSVRSATERKRVASLVQQGEKVLVMFSGAAPFPCVIAKNTDVGEVIGIELNERGHELGMESVMLNKLTNVGLIQGDVREVVPELASKGVMFDRIIMPLPHTGHDFLDEAFSVCHPGTVIHLYDFEQEDAFEEGAEKARAGAARNNVAIEILGIVPSGQHSPRLYRICVDFKVLASSPTRAQR